MSIVLYLLGRKSLFLKEMNEKQLISAIKELKKIKPRKEWVVFAKSQIFTETMPSAKKQRFAGILDVLYLLTEQRKLAYALATFLFIIIGTFGFAQYTVPGDLLFSVKKIAEQSQATLTGGNNLKNSFDNYDRRVQDLTRVVKENKENNIPSAISEVKLSMMGAVKVLTAAVAQKDRNIKEIAAEVKKLKDNKKQLDALGIDIGETDGTKELDNVLAPLVESEINALEEATLTEEQQVKLEEIKKLYGEEKFSEALEEILLINLSPA
ncbi:MAG: hypothetical protein CEN87_188 [Parcubacteria group bacterium Licking1014_1]|nr:MAG: hypothetical protein CEN87_188 [Parcubacteria group bacterium Licking1014_1]